MNIYEKLLNIQLELKAPKSQYNGFGKYSYRSCEDILEALKPCLKQFNLTVILTDNLVEVNGRNYVQATVTLIDIDDPKQQIVNTAFAREEETKKGMDGSQITGASSSYARKYALNGLFAIDDNKDSDSTNKGEEKKTKDKVEAEDNINDNVRVFLKEKHTNDFLIEWRCGGFGFLDQVCKILLGTGRFYSINKFAKSCGSRRDCKVIFLNDRKIIKIGKKEFTRKQFSEARNDFLKIIEIDKIIKGDNNESV